MQGRWEQQRPLPKHTRAHTHARAHTHHTTPTHPPTHHQPTHPPTHRPPRLTWLIIQLLSVRAAGAHRRRGSAYHHAIKQVQRLAPAAAEGAEAGQGHAQARCFAPPAKGALWAVVVFGHCAAALTHALQVVGSGAVVAAEQVAALAAEHAVVRAGVGLARRHRAPVGGLSGAARGARLGTRAGAGQRSRPRYRCLSAVRQATALGPSTRPPPPGLTSRSSRVIMGKAPPTPPLPATNSPVRRG